MSSEHTIKRYIEANQQIAVRPYADIVPLTFRDGKQVYAVVKCVVLG
jgi:hypothetical protein